MLTGIRPLQECHFEWQRNIQWHEARAAFLRQLSFLYCIVIQSLQMCCCRHSSGIKHFNVERTTSTYYLKDIQFTTLDQLVRYYSQTDVPNKELIRGVRLKHAITRSAPHVIVSRDDQQAESANPDIYIHPVCMNVVCDVVRATIARPCKAKTTPKPSRSKPSSRPEPSRPMPKPLTL